MNRNTNIVLALIAGGLFAYITLYERHTLTSGELTETQNQLLQRFVRSRVDRVEVDRGDEQMVLVRTRDEDDLLGTWNLQAPVEALADDDAVGSLLSAVQYASARRTLQEVSAEDLARYGLDAPQVSARFTVANEVIAVAFGERDPTETGIYMQAGDNVHVVGIDVFEAFDHDAGHYRSKRLLGDGVLLASRLELSGEGGARTLVSTNDRWMLQRDSGSVLAASTLLEEALQAFNDVQVERFVDGELGDVWLEAVATVTGDEDRTVRLQVGQRCTDDNERRVRVDEGDVGCVLVSRLDALLRPADDFRESRPITLSDLELESLSLTSGRDTLEVAQPDGSWTWTLKRGTAESTGSADDEALATWLQSIRRARAQSFVVADDLRAYGLASPAATLRIEATEERVEELHIGSVSTEGLYVRRGDEPQVLVLPASAESLFAVSALSLRNRRVIDRTDRDVVRFGVTRADGVERLERTDDGWMVRAPIDVKAASAATEALRALSRLQVEQFVADGASAEHGLNTPAMTIAARYEPDEEDPADVTLRVGAETEGGRFAQLEGDGAVFVVSSRFVERFASPFVSRRLLGTDVIFIDKVILEAGGRTLELSHDGRVFASDDGPIDPVLSEALGTAIERLSASGTVRYGDALASEGLAPPRIRVRIERGEQAEEPHSYTLLIGAPIGTGDEVYLRREDLGVTFSVSEESVAPMIQALE